MLPFVSAMLPLMSAMLPFMSAMLPFMSAMLSFLYSDSEMPLELLLCHIQPTQAIVTV